MALTALSAIMTMLFQMPLNTFLTPSHAEFQSPVNAPLINWIMPPRMLSLRFLANSVRLPVSASTAVTTVAIPAITSGMTLPVKKKNPSPVATMPAISISVFCKFAPLSQMSLNAVIIIAAPAMTRPMPAPTLPNARASPPARAAVPAREPSKFFQLTPLFHASDRLSHKRINPPTAIRIPPSLVRIFPKSPGSELPIFHSASPAAISMTASAIFFKRSLMSSM